jgi:hypothetical protein
MSNEQDRHVGIPREIIPAGKEDRYVGATRQTIISSNKQERHVGATGEIKSITNNNNTIINETNQRSVDTKINK